MASVLPLTGTQNATDELAEILNGLGRGTVSLEVARAAMAGAVRANADDVPVLHGLIEQACQDGRISRDDYQVLAHEFEREIPEDPPTDADEYTAPNPEAAARATPGNDTVTDPDAHAPAAAPLYPGAVLAQRYVLQAQVRSSQMSEVFKALDRHRQQAGDVQPWVALKHAAPGAAAASALHREAMLAQRLQHPHIARVLDAHNDPPHAFITREWLEGESLADLLTRERAQPLPPATVARMLAEVGAALSFAHCQGIAHADVKPGNIFITADGAARLLDFGAAQVADAIDAGNAARTMAYASCELLEGAAATPQDDVYSLACVAYRMIAGRRAYGHQDALAAERSGRQPAPIRALPPPQWAALQRALALRRAARTPDMATFLREFFSTAALDPQPAPPPADTLPAPAVRRAATPDRTARSPVLVAAAALAAIIILAILLWPQPDEPAPPELVAAPATGTASPVERTAAVAPVAAPPTAALPAQSPVPVSTTAPTPRRIETPPVPAPAATPPPSQPAEAPVTAGTVTTPAADTPPVATSTATAPGDSLQPPLPPAASGSAQPAPDAPSEVALPASPDAQIPPAPAMREVPLTELRFKRYVEPKDKRGTRSQPVGWVEISFVVSADGTTRDISVVASSPAGRYDDAALSAVKRWRFAPVVEDGQAAERKTSVRLKFQPE